MFPPLPQQSAPAAPLLSPPHLAPLGALVEGAQQGLHCCGGQLQHGLAAQLLDLAQGGHGVGHNHGVGVADQVLHEVGGWGG